LKGLIEKRREELLKDYSVNLEESQELKGGNVKNVGELQIVLDLK
jgi:hypothetical protein